MIKGFKHKGLEDFYLTGSVRRIQPTHAKKLNRILSVLEIAATPEDLNLPSFRLHELKGDRKGEWAVTVRANWRVTFRFVGTDVELVDYLDYH